MLRNRFWIGALVMSAWALGGCGGSSKVETDGGPAIGGDSGTDPGPGETGPGDGGNTVPFPDAGETPIAQTPVKVTPLPVGSANWTFYGKNEGTPTQVNGVTADGDGNLWVAGGEEGLFLLKRGTTTFRKFTMADGLRPYGFQADGSAPPGTPYLNVISVEGGPGSSVFVGYFGKRVSGKKDCESNFDLGNDGIADPNIYKSGDADRVTIAGNGISVVHYDISTGPGLVGKPGDSYYVGGREKICDIHRIVYDYHPPVNGQDHSSVWFGANHGFSRGEPGYTGNPTCNGQYACSGVQEHIHPYPADGSDRLGDFRGVAPDKAGNVWAGGAVASTKIPWASHYDWFNSIRHVEGKEETNKFDFWPGAWPAFDDMVTSMAVAGDETLWVASSVHGLAHLTAAGTNPQYFTKSPGQLFTNSVTNVAADPIDPDSVWVGYGYAGGISRIRTLNNTTTFKNFGYADLGELSNLHVLDIQFDETVKPGRRVLVAFTDFNDHKPFTNRPFIRSGVIGIYTGD